MKKQKDKPSFGQTFSSGWKAVVKSSTAKYILCHCVSSQYHKEGEKQEILLDEIILGRSDDCHVRFDESFPTVSRHHAKIIRKDGRWMLVQMSQTNTTFLNGNAIRDTWFLQDGDEIQLALNGPKLQFLMPEERVEWKLTNKLSAFNDQVIRPYKSAVFVIASSIVLLVAAIVLLGIFSHKQREYLEAQQVQIKQKEQQIQEQQTQIEAQRQQIDELFNQVLQANEELARTAALADSANEEAIKAKAQAFKAKAESIKSQENLENVEEQMRKLREEMDDFYNGIINGQQ